MAAVRSPFYIAYIVSCESFCIRLSGWISSHIGEPPFLWSCDIKSEAISSWMFHLTLDEFCRFSCEALKDVWPYPVGFSSSIYDEIVGLKCLKSLFLNFPWNMLLNPSQMSASIISLFLALLALWLGLGILGPHQSIFSHSKGWWVDHFTIPTR